MRKIRLALAKWLWPKDVKQGECFTIVRHIRIGGELTTDGSWVGDNLRADVVDGDRILFSQLNEYGSPPEYEKVWGHPLMPGINCIVKPISISLTQAQRSQLYNNAKQNRAISL